MRARVIALEVADFEAWADRQKNDIKAAQTELADARKQREAADKTSRQQ
jgi:heme/copper-type cytochrome/quinol oxidase subunit 2